MNKATILKKAIEKAIKNGWKPIKLDDGWLIGEIETTEGTASFHKRKKYSRKREHSLRISTVLFLRNIIFFSDFAKHFWGKEDMWKKTKCDCGGAGIHFSNDEDVHYLTCSKLKAKRGYKYYQHKMLDEVQEGRCLIKYLEQFI